MTNSPDTEAYFEVEIADEQIFKNTDRELRNLLQYVHYTFRIDGILTHEHQNLTQTERLVAIGFFDGPLDLLEKVVTQLNSIEGAEVLQSGDLNAD